MQLLRHWWPLILDDLERYVVGDRLRCQLDQREDGRPFSGQRLIRLFVLIESLPASPVDVQLVPVIAVVVRGFVIVGIAKRQIDLGFVHRSLQNGPVERSG